jgi:hypothetical protein
LAGFAWDSLAGSPEEALNAGIPSALYGGGIFFLYEHLKKHARRFEILLASSLKKRYFLSPLQIQFMEAK